MTHSAPTFTHDSDPPKTAQQAQAAHRARLARMGGLQRVFEPQPKPAQVRRAKTIKTVPFEMGPIEERWARMWFGDLVFGEPRIEQLTIDDIQHAVAKYFKMSIGVLVSRCRSYCVAHPRQIGIYLSRIHTKASTTTIARAFGLHNHTTALHAIHKLQTLIAKNAPITADVRAIEHALGR